MEVNSFQEIQNRKDGYFRILYWKDLYIKQTLSLKNTEEKVKEIKDLLNERQGACIKIATKYDPSEKIDYDNCFIECLKRTQGVSRVIDK